VIVLDTNVLSELMRRQPAAAVINWLDSQTEPLWTTAVTVHEIVYGIERLKDEHRQSALRAAFARALAELVEPRVLAFDDEAARAAGVISARREREGRAMHIADSQIAGIVQCHAATLVTRDLGDFADLDFHATDPWQTPGAAPRK
jgi:predicted nucleic acid-binding protein